MGCSKLPIIDFSKPELKSGTSEWDLVKGQVRQALQDFGCFEALFDNIPLEIRKAMFEGMEELFDLPLEIKTRIVSKIPYYGYLGKPPLFESIGFEEANDVEKLDALTRMFWPQGNPSFSKSIQSFAKQLSELNRMIRRMILEIFQVEKYVDEHMDSSDNLFKVMRYEGPKSNETQVGLVAHIDKDIITILHQNEVNGLGVQTSTGEWIDWVPSKHSFIVIIGESFQAWLNGRVKATCHRVNLSGDKPRYSVGLFTVPKAGYMIKAPEELVDEAHPLLYEPFDYDKFLDFCVTNIERYANSTLQDYCGVKN